MTKEKLLHALPGFLGIAEDWDSMPIPLQAHDTTSLGQPSPQFGLRQWAQQFNQSCAQPGILMGYSLGARLAMHALLESPEKWQGAVLISGHPGLLSDVEKAKRLRDDLLWADRFETEGWSDLLQAWNAQPIFRTSKAIPRKESFYSRNTLANILRFWSLGHQDLLSDKLMQLDIPILWIVGEKDIGCRTIAQSLSWLNRHSKTVMMPNSGHRVLLDDPHQLSEKVRQFLNTIKGEE